VDMCELSSFSFLSASSLLVHCSSEQLASSERDCEEVEVSEI
jgi:hypothetical protein